MVVCRSARGALSAFLPHRPAWCPCLCWPRACLHTGWRGLANAFEAAIGEVLAAPRAHHSGPPPPPLPRCSRRSRTHRVQEVELGFCPMRCSPRSRRRLPRSVLHYKQFPGHAASISGRQSATLSLSLPPCSLHRSYCGTLSRKARPRLPRPPLVAPGLASARAPCPRPPLAPRTRRARHFAHPWRTPPPADMASQVGQRTRMVALCIRHIPC